MQGPPWRRGEKNDASKKSRKGKKGGPYVVCSGCNKQWIYVDRIPTAKWCNLCGKAWDENHEN